jgi:hypothetical protein
MRKTTQITAVVVVVVAVIDSCPSFISFLHFLPSLPFPCVFKMSIQMISGLNKKSLQITGHRPSISKGYYK